MHGTVPHCTMPFKGKRYTAVYLTRKNGLGVNLPMQAYSESLGFTLPIEVWLAMGNVDGDRGKPRTYER